MSSDALATVSVAIVVLVCAALVALCVRVIVQALSRSDRRKDRS